MKSRASAGAGACGSMWMTRDSIILLPDGGFPMERWTVFSNASFFERFGVWQDDFAKAEDGAVDGVDEETDHESEDNDGERLQYFIDLVSDDIKFILVVVRDFSEHVGGGTGFRGELHQAGNGTAIRTQQVGIKEEGLMEAEAFFNAFLG